MLAQVFLFACLIGLGSAVRPPPPCVTGCAPFTVEETCGYTFDEAHALCYNQGLVLPNGDQEGFQAMFTLFLGFSSSGVDKTVNGFWVDMSRPEPEADYFVWANGQNFTERVFPWGPAEPSSNGSCVVYWQPGPGFVVNNCTNNDQGVVCQDVPCNVTTFFENNPELVNSSFIDVNATDFACNLTVRGSECQPVCLDGFFPTNNATCWAGEIVNATCGREFAVTSKKNKYNKAMADCESEFGGQGADFYLDTDPNDAVKAVVKAFSKKAKRKAKKNKPFEVRVFLGDRAAESPDGTGQAPGRGWDFADRDVDFDLLQPFTIRRHFRKGRCLGVIVRINKKGRLVDAKYQDFDCQNKQYGLCVVPPSE
eukprot:m.213684 g.213684  ORF g.213684 m.213684 type:complete len:367 (+) comp26176_c2_seq3:62-1162(+)